MFPLDALAQATGGTRPAGRFAVDVILLLAPVGNAPPDVTRLAGRPTAARVSGRFVSTDAAAVTAIEPRGEEWMLSIAITRTESPDLEPAPRDLFVAIAFGSDTPPARVVLRFSGRLRAFDGSERPLDDLPPQPQVITIA